MSSKKLKDKLIFNVTCTLIILMACFSVISILTAKDSFSNNAEKLWDGVTIASSFSAGNGTVDNPYLISDGEEFAYFKKLIEESNDIYGNKYYALSNNINLDNHEWTSIGKENNIFKGYLDGRGYSVKNVKILEGTIINNYEYYGLFSITENASITNLNIDNLIINPSKTEKSVKIGTVVGDFLNTGNDTSKLSNIAIINGKIDLGNVLIDGNNIIGGVASNISSNVEFYNIYVNVDFSSISNLNVSKVAHSIECDSNYIITNVTGINDTIKDFNSSKTNTNEFIYEKPNFINIANNNTMISSEDLLYSLNDNLDLDYYWNFSDNNLIIQREDSFVNNEIITSFSFSINSPIALHDSAIENDTVYVNDLVSDYNNFMGLNYTDYTDSGTLPTGVNRNIYNDSNLVQVYTMYDGMGIMNSDSIGYVSLSEKQSKFIYYNYYHVENGYVTFPLIDNPFADRPNDMAFNGWVTDYPGAYVYLDNDTYTRYVKIPVSNVNDIISINFRASWVNANTFTLTSSNTDYSSSLDTIGMKIIREMPIYEDIDATKLYLTGTTGFFSNFPNNSFNSAGNNISGNRCNTWGGCTYYYHPTDPTYNDSTTYYELVNGSMSVFVPKIIGYEKNPALVEGASSAGLFKVVNLSRGEAIEGYYDNTGNMQSGTCNSNSCTYYKYLQYYDEVGNENVYTSGETYYYLVTRDTNIVVLESNVSLNLTGNKPLTLTGINNDNDYSNFVYNIGSNYISLGSDLRIEHITLTSNRAQANTNPLALNNISSYIYGNWNNFKIGRGIKRSGNSVTATVIMGGNGNATGSSNNLTRYKFVIESGFYNAVSTTNCNSLFGDSYIDGYAIYGNDYDRVSKNDNNLDVYYSAAGSWDGNFHSNSEQTGIAFHTNVKSGKFGSGKYDYSTGLYVGGRGINRGTHYAAREATIEGGWIYNLNGGPLTASNRTNINDTYMNIKGGSIDMVYGGAGATATYGNRIINITGGVVNYSVFGGSNGYTGSDGGTYEGTLEGNTFIYVGGNAIVGDDTLITNGSTLFGAEAGSVFGIGNGNDTSSRIGSANSSNIIIDGTATIKRNVYGGGNYGAVGINAQGSTLTNIKILNGSIFGSIYGGGNNNGSGSQTVTSTVNITMENGKVAGSIYGGSRTKGTVYGSTNVSVLGGEVSFDVYGGGEGGYTDATNQGTFVTENVNVNIGNSSNTNQLVIGGEVYGGSAYGSVNGDANTSALTTYSTNVTVNRGVITKNVFGGGKGNATFIPNVFGNVTVTINGGNIGNVYGGNNQAGSPYGTDTVYLNGGTIGSVFGGGNNVGQSNTNVYLQGSTITNLFGGSNSSGTVDVSNVFVKSGQVSNIYGGNNVGGMTNKTNVEVTGGTINGDIYGGGSLANSNSSKVIIGGVGVNDVYGGGEKASVDNTSITINEATGNNLFGGSNVSGEVITSDILFNSGTFINIYGGNNQGGDTATTNITVNNGTIGSVYGGGNKASSTTSNIIINNGIITDVYGGGSEAGLTTSDVLVLGGTIDNVYGGSNKSGDIDNSNVTVGGGLLDADLVFLPAPAENWQSTVYATYVDVTFTITNKTTQPINNWDVQFNMPTDTVLHSNYSNTDIVINNGIGVINEVNRYDANSPNVLAPGASYTLEFALLTNTPVDDYRMDSIILDSDDNAIIETGNIKINNIYGGNNKGGTTNTSLVDINMGNIGNVFGGGNEAVVNDAKVTINNALVNTVYGGGNAASVTNNTYLDINVSKVLNNIYGGGNEGTVGGNTRVFVTNGLIEGSAYAGGNGSTAIVSGNTKITIDGNSVIGSSTSKPPMSGSVFGSGNAAATGTPSSGNSVATVNIVGATIYGNVYGGANTSVVYGKTITNIGAEVVKDNSLIEGDIIIHGTVFGGGEANASGDENYDFDFISVTDAINIYIDGAGYISNNHQFIMKGSIFGSGNASSSSGTSDISIKNLGTRDLPSKNISIQRANTVMLDNSVIELSGTTDRTNDYSTIKYSFNRIDSLTILNNTVLLLKQNANLLKEFNSMAQVDGKLVPAEVSINDETKTVTKNVDNRLYLIPNRNLNITTNQAATAYGKVTGMTFFGMYNSYDNGSFQYGVYDDDVNYGDSADAGDAIIGGSYVLGLHHASHDITKDGFYTNYLSEDYSTVTTSYIEPTPPSAGYYMWMIGIQAINYTVDLTASKYSSLGALELAMLDFSDGDTTFDVIGFNSEGLKKGVSLVDSSEVPKIADTPEDANKVFGLSMKAETREWTGHGTTKFLSVDSGKYTGDTSYKTDSQKVAPSMMFYLYHAKNITINEDIGTVVVSLQAKTPINEIESEVRLITITVNIAAKNFADGDFYDASITYDKKYEMPSATSVNITNQSQFSTYYSIFSEVSKIEDFYGLNNDNYHALVADRALPIGTQITMIDIGDGKENPNYYYFTVDEDNYNKSLAELNKDGETTYRLSDFIKMGSTDQNNTYDDATNNKRYYSDKDKRVVEEFIFIFDFKETTTTGTHLGNKMLFELRNNEDRSLISVLGIRQNIMLYNTYDSSNVVLDEKVSTGSNYLYYDLPSEFNLETNVLYDQTANSESIINTNYESNSMGLNVEVIDNTGKVVSSSMLTGTNIKIDGVSYFADSDGVFRIKLANKVSNLKRKFYITTDKMLPTGNYTFKFTLFASPDGRHNSHTLEAIPIEIPITVVGSDNSIVVDTDDGTKLIFGETGLNELGEAYNEYEISYNSVLNNPNIRISLYKRNIDSKDTIIYQEIPINNLFTNQFPDPSSKGYAARSDYEKMLDISTNEKVSFNFAENITSGTYKISFKLYDKNQLIEEEVKHIIVRKNVE